MRHIWFLAVLALPAPAHATIVAATSDADLVRHADAIVVGVVVHTETRLVARQRIVTRATLTVEQTIYGARVDHVILQVPGGVLPNGLEAVVSGVPELRKGERWVAFLERASDGTYRPLGMAFGMVRVRDDGTVERSLSGLTLVGRGGEPVATTGLDLRGMRFEDYVAGVEGRLGKVAP